MKCFGVTSTFIEIIREGKCEELLKMTKNKLLHFNKKKQQQQQHKNRLHFLCSKYNAWVRFKSY